MFLLRTDFKKDLLILLIITILIGTFLVVGGGYLTEKYFSEMVNDIIGEYGEYDFIFTLAADKEDIALKQINNLIDNNFPGIKISPGPNVIGSANYLLKIPEKYKNKTFFENIRKYFADIPGLMDINIISEPRLIVRNFRGESLKEIKPKIEKIDGIDFTYEIGDGFDVIVEKVELLSGVEDKINKVLADYKLFEVRYPLDQNPDDLEKLKKEIINIASELGLKNITDVTGNVDSSRTSLLKSLNQMKAFLLSYATKIVVGNIEEGSKIYTGSKLFIETPEGKVILKVIDHDHNELTALIQEGEIPDTEFHAVYLQESGEYVGEGEINNPRQNLAEALERLNDISPGLKGFIDQSEELIAYSERINDDLKAINEGITKFNDTSTEINEMLYVWEEEQLSFFLSELQNVLNEIENNAGNINEIQKQMINTSNNLKEGARLIEERIIFVPRSNELYKQLNDLKNVFLKLSSLLDENYDLTKNDTSNFDALLSSLADSREKIGYLIDVEKTLNQGIDIKEVSESLEGVKKSAELIQKGDLQEEITSLQELLIDIQTSHLPVILEQLQYIQNSLPDMEEKEIIETINLIDSYIAGEVIPGDQIQLLIKDDYDEKELGNKVENLIGNSGVSLVTLEAGKLQSNPRGEIFNLLRQVKAVISIIIALIFTLFILIMDQSLLVSVIRLNNGNGYIYNFISGSIIFVLIYHFSGISFPYLNVFINLIAGGLLGILVALFSNMLNPVNREEWEAGKALGFSPAEIMYEIIIPAGKPGLLYLLNYPRVIFK